ncbi:CobW family GTP-binding protein [Desulfocurvibacter africanus]|uniref:CobW family GTP-binding protein n=1 Tax=Desulfocurvibacter africanus TaxID=873 RepID=UPI000420745E|nr:GTP-binding protein [Desulfocurvibacter africanus]
MDLRCVTPITPGHGEPWLPGFLRALLLRAQFSRADARALGWRGIRPSLAHGESWTCRVQGLPGVFGLLFEGERATTSSLSGSFSLLYFPHPDEPRAERYPLAAAAATQRQDYWDLVRDFAAFPEPLGLFRLATLTLGVSPAGDALGVELQALSRQCVVALDGVRFPGDPARFVVHPGGMESDVPAYGPAFIFLRSLASTLTYGLGEPPSAMALTITPGHVLAYTAAGYWEARAHESVRSLSLRLDYGAAAPAPTAGPGEPGEPATLFAQASTARRTAQRRSWTKGAPLGLMGKQPWHCAHIPEWLRATGRPVATLRPELLVLTGFLGSGKTTLLRRFIEYNLQRSRFVAIIQNEIGEIGLDGKLLDHDFSVVEMDEGCVCCSLSGQLGRGLAQVLARFRPDVVVLETSGMANPKNLLSELDELEALVCPGLVLTVVDGANLDMLLNNGLVARDQIEVADVLILNKTDLVSQAERARALDRMRSLNPGAMLVEATHGDIPFGLLDEAQRQTRPGLAPHLPASTLLPTYERGQTHADAGFVARTVRLDKPIGMDRLQASLRTLSREAYRIKGIVDIAGEATPRLVQSVAGTFSVTLFPEPPTSERFLVFIGRDFPHNAEEAFRAELLPAHEA